MIIIIQILIRMTQQPSWIGSCAASCAVVLTHPIDTLKVRFQVANELTGKQPRLFSIFSQMKPVDYYRGIAGALTKQSIYTGIRFKVFEGTRDRIGIIPGAILAGGVGAFCTTPIDQSMIRQQSTGSQVGFLKTLGTLAREGELWKNAGIQTIRASCVTLGQFPTFYYLTREYPWLKESVWGNLGAGFIAGTAASILAAPFDIVKARVMSAKVRGSSSEYQGKGLMDIFRKTAGVDGRRVLVRGALLTWMRLGPQSTLMLTIASQIGKMIE